MLKLVSLIIALVVFAITLAGLVPLLGWLNWIGLLLGTLGGFTGALSKNKAGLVVNAMLMSIAAFRLFLGGGIL